MSRGGLLRHSIRDAFWVVATLWILLNATSASAQARCEQPVARIVSAEGDILVRPPSGMLIITIAAGAQGDICAGESVQAGSRSRAAVLLLTFQSNHPSRPEHDHQGSSGNAGGTALPHRLGARLHPFVQPGRAGARHTHALRDGGNGGHGVFCFLRPAERGHNRRRHGWHRSCVQERRCAAARSGRGCSRASNWPGAKTQYSPQ